MCEGRGAGVDGSLGAEQTWEQRLLSSSAALAAELASRLEPLKHWEQSMRALEGYCAVVSVCCSHMVESALTGSSVILEQTLTPSLK